MKQELSTDIESRKDAVNELMKQLEKAKLRHAALEEELKVLEQQKEPSVQNIEQVSKFKR